MRLTMSVYLATTFVIMVLTTKEGVLMSSEETWPQGTYGLPKAKSGCPIDEELVWDQGWRLQDIEDDRKNMGESKVSVSFHMEAEIDREFINRTFCIKKKDNRQLQVNNKTWPKGSYCIYEYGNVCPRGMKNGFIKWDDENSNNGNRIFGKLPKGHYDNDTIIFYCCQKGHWQNSIELPVDSPFYLLPYKTRFQKTARCQRVKWAISTLEYIQFDTEDTNNQDMFYNQHVSTNEVKSLPTMYYCYYAGCRYKLTEDSGAFMSPRFNMAISYPDFQYCSWLITVNTTLIVSLNFTFLHIPNCNENFIDIYDGTDKTSLLLAKHCGCNATENATVLSTGNSIYVVLKSGNYSRNLEHLFGFQATYRTQLKPMILINASSNQKNKTDASFIAVIAILPILAGILLMVIISVMMFYWRRQKRQNHISNSSDVIQQENPSYESRFQISSSPPLQERKWEMESTIGKESENPVYEPGIWDDSYEVYCSSVNITYEPSIGVIGVKPVTENLSDRLS